MSRRLALIGISILVVALAAFGAYRYFGNGRDAPKFRLAKAEEGPLTAVVAATGTLNPVVSVQIGSQVSGQIKEIYVDFNSEVKATQLVARIDPENFQHKVRQAEADLDAARAAALTQRADIARVEAILRDAERDFERKKSLVDKKFISTAERDKAESVYDTARAQLEVAKAQAQNSAAIVNQRAAQLAQAKVDLGRTEIRSPVNGIVVKRSVDAGQTVAASLQSPELFVIAKNLTDMQVETSIDEADVGRIRVGQKATFTVDAFPGRSFDGAVMQVRKAAKVESNVVTYTVVISAANPDLSLLPGMTANVRIVSARKDMVLKVPNAALRFRPTGSGDDKANAAPAAGGAHGGPAAAKQLRDRLVKELNLDAAQQDKLDAIQASMRDKFAAARDLPDAERAKAMERNRAEQREKIGAILTAEQKKRYDEMAAESQSARSTGGGGSGRVWVIGEDGKPKVVPVRLGLTDGTMTEIVGGEIVAGTEVIVGNVATGAAKPAATSGPRMF